MTNSQETVDQIRSFLQSADQTLTESAKQLAEAYASACQEINTGLRRCAEFLQQGLRSEAIHLAEAEPQQVATGPSSFPREAGRKHGNAIRATQAADASGEAVRSVARCF